MEHRLAALWAQVLDRTVDTADANFFLLGGDSLLMIRLGTLARATLGHAPDLATLLRAPRLADQAALFEALDAPREAQAGAYECGVI